jgi:4-hydroxy-3-methylbut-2-enyl diphosphate reductase
MKIDIDINSGFCFGVVNAICKAEEELEKHGQLFCLGDIVHNNAELERLKKKGLKIIDKEQFKGLENTKVLIRAHGEPPETYSIAKEKNIELIDASCSVVLKLQQRIRKKYIEYNGNGQIVIFGKKGHAEVNGLVGQTEGKAIVVNSNKDLNKIDFSKPISLFSQTTMSIEGFVALSNEIRRLMEEATGIVEVPLYVNDTICRQVSNRAPHLEKFSKNYDVILFVSGKDSSNGKVLYEICKNSNEHSYFITGIKDINSSWLTNASSVGICGATSTPRWLMEEVAGFLKNLS